MFVTIILFEGLECGNFSREETIVCFKTTWTNHSSDIVLQFVQIFLNQTLLLLLCKSKSESGYFSYMNGMSADMNYIERAFFNLTIINFQIIRDVCRTF